MRLYPFALLAASLVSLLGVACNGCGKDKPYTPFGVASSLPAAAPSAEAPAPSSATPEPQLARRAQIAPPQAQRWNVAGLDLQSPPGRIFAQGLPLSPGADGKSSVAAWTLPESAEADALAGELWLYPVDGAARKLFDLPAFLPTGASCRHEVALVEVSSVAVVLDVQATCDTELQERAATRAFAVLDPTSTTPFRFGLRAAGSAPGESWTLKLSPHDEDGDGRNDYRLDATLSAGSKGAAATARLVWFDRAAGVSRDARQPERSLVEQLQKETLRARNAKNAKAALERAETLRRLLSSLCAESATPRLFDWEGTPLKCHPLAESIDRLAQVEAVAALTLGDVPRALSVITRDGWYLQPMRTAQRAAILKELEKKLTSVPAARIAIGVRPKSPPPPHWSPLAFDAQGALLIQSDSGLFRLAADGAREELVDPASADKPWPLAVTNAAGERLLAVSYSCDRSEVGLLMASGATLPTLQPLLAPRPGACGSVRFAEGFVPAPVGAGEGFHLLVGGVLVSTTEAPPQLHSGSARSPDALHTAIPTPVGLLVQGSKSELWKSEGWDLAPARSCVVSSGGVRAACVRGGRAELYLRAEPAP